MIIFLMISSISVRPSYNNAEVLYQDIELRAGIIIIDYSKNLAYARGIVDSLGNLHPKTYF